MEVDWENPSIGLHLSPEELAKIAREENNEPEPKMLERDIRALKQWIKKQPHLAKSGKQDDHFLHLVLRGCRFSLERSKKKIEGWNTIRNMCPDVYDGWDVRDPDNAYLVNLGVNVMLPGYDKKGRRVVVQRLSMADPARFKPADVMKVSLMVGDITMQNTTEQMEICGAVVISDNVGMTLGHVKQFTPAWGKKISTIFQEVYPSMPKTIHLVNMPSIMETTFGMVRGFMKDKMKDRMMLHPKSDLSALHEDVGRDVLPAEYGGTNANMAKLVFAHRDFLLEQSKLKTDERKRQGAVKTYSDIFGMEGSFRQLEFD